MLSKSVKSKRRHQAAEARRIENALWAAVPAEAGEARVDGRFTCAALNEQAGMGRIREEAIYLARLPRGSEARGFAAAQTNSDLCAALGHNTAAWVLEEAGLL